MEEVPGFYTPTELLLSRSNELRNAACLVADVKFHTGAWHINEMRRYYRDEAGFPAGRIDFETVKCSIFPANRAMYWTGVRQIKQARARWPGHVRDFHDGLIAAPRAAILAIDDLLARYEDSGAAASRRPAHAFPRATARLNGRDYAALARDVTV